MKQNPITSRLAARLHQQQIKLLGSTDTIAVRVGAVYDKLVSTLASLAVDAKGATPGAAAIAKAVKAAFAAAKQEIADAFRKQIVETYKASQKAIRDVVPPKWFRVYALTLAGGSTLLAKTKPHKEDWDVRLISKFAQELVDVGNGSRYPRTPDLAEADDGEEESPYIDDAKWQDAVDRMYFPPLDSQRTDQLLKSPGHGGLTWEERFHRYAEPDQSAIASELQAGLAAEESAVGLRKRIEGLIAMPRYRAEMIARTEGRRVAEMANKEATEALGDMISGYQIIATMDQFTRPDHAARNGKVYHKQPDGRYIADDGEELPVCPYEFNCRCFSTPILAPPEVAHPDLVTDFQDAGGEAIPDPSAYSQWFDDADEAERKTAVGVKRYNAVASKVDDPQQDVEWADFLSPDGNLLSPAKLKKETDAAKAKRRAEVDAMLAKREDAFRQVAAAGMLKKEPAKPKGKK